MFNLLKSDLYRLVHERKFWVALIAMLVSMGLLAGFSWGNAVSSADASPIPGLDMSADDMIASITVLYANALFPAGLLATVLSILAALFLGSDFGTGFVKNIWSVRSRSSYFVEKLLFFAMLSAAFLAVGVIVVTYECWVMGIAFQPADSLAEFWMWMLLVWMSATAYLFIVIAITCATGSKAVGLIAAVLVSTGLFGDVAIGAARALSGDANAMNWIMRAGVIHLSGGDVGVFSYAPTVAFVAGVVIAACAALTILAGGDRDV